MTENGAYPTEQKALNAALAKAQGEFPPITREKTVRTGAYTYSYASLDVILKAVRPALSKHGLAVVQRLEYPGGVESLCTEVRHAEGAVIRSTFPIGERPQNPQQLGSLLTYLRRYSIVAMLGIAAEEDDDGQQAAAAPRKPPAANRAPTSPGVPEPQPKAKPLEFDTPGDVVFTFGKYKDKTIAEVAAEDGGRQYLGWVAHEAKNEQIKAAALMFLRDDDIPF